MRKGLSVALTVAVFMVTPGCLAKGYEAHPLTLALVERLVEEHADDVSGHILEHPPTGRRVRGLHQ